jgi:hypothetical protein
MDIEINKTQYNEIESFCKLNKITDITEFINECITIGFNIKEFGTTPFVKKSEYKESQVTAKKNRVIPTVPKEERSQYNLGVSDKPNRKNDLYDE